MLVQYYWDNDLKQLRNQRRFGGIRKSLISVLGTFIWESWVESSWCSAHVQRLGNVKYSRIMTFPKKKFFGHKCAHCVPEKQLNHPLYNKRMPERDCNWALGCERQTTLILCQFTTRNPKMVHICYKSVQRFYRYSPLM